MPNETTHFPPLGEVVAVDPYPVHGLAVDTASRPYYTVYPHDGRPGFEVRQVGGFDANQKLPPYRPTGEGVLWYIGRPDPPVTPLIEASGRTAWGRRILVPEADPRLPARLEGRTRHVRVWLNGGYAELSPVGAVQMQVDGVTSAVGALDLSADFGGAPKDLHIEGGDGGLESESGLAWWWAARFLDASPDGCRRLFAVSLERNTPSTSFAASAVVGIFEVVLSSEDGAISGAIIIHKTAEDCLGVYTQTGTNDLYEEYSEEHDGVWHYGLRAKDTPGPAHAGTTSRTRQFTGMILGASFVDGEISYHTLDRKIVVTDSCSWDRPDNVNGEPRNPATAVFEGERRWEVKLSINGRQVTAVREYKGGQTHIRQSLSGLADEITSRWGEATLGSFTRTDEVGLATILRPVYDQPAVHARGNYPSGDWGEVFVVSWRRRWSAVATRWGEYWAQGPMIHEYGIEGDWVVTGVAHFGTNEPPWPINNCAACPITHNAVRAVDIPGARSVAYI